MWTLVAQFVWGTETWSRRGEAFSVYYGLFARISVFETRDRVLGLRPPLAGLPKLDPAPATVAFVSVMIGTVTFDGLTQGTLWQDFAEDSLGVGRLARVRRRDRSRRSSPRSA